MRRPPAQWTPELDALLGTLPDYALALKLDFSPTAVVRRRKLLGVKPFSGKMRVKCSGCGKTVFRMNGRAPCCKKCKSRRDQESRADDRSKYMDAWRAANREHLRKYHREWDATHPERHNVYQRRYRRNERQRNDDLIASLPCLSCGMQHSPERRQTILSRMLPCLAEEVHEAWSCIWGEGGRENKSSAGTQRLYRDLKAMGSVRQGSTWYPAAEARSSA